MRRDETRRDETRREFIFSRGRPESAPWPLATLELRELVRRAEVRWRAARGGALLAALPLAEVRVRQRCRNGASLGCEREETAKGETRGETERKREEVAKGETR